MTVKELLERVRQRLKDTVGPDADRLWVDSELIDDYANEARLALFAAVGEMLIDSSTTADSAGIPLATLPIVKDTALYDVSPKILQTLRLQLDSQDKPLSPITLQALDGYNPNWRTAASGKPQVYVTDYETGKYLFFPTPDADDTARMTNAVYPLTELSYRATGASLGFREQYHKDLIPKILALAFMKGGGVSPDVYKPTLAAMYEAQFLKRVDEINIEVYQKNRGPRSNRPRRANISK